MEIPETKRVIPKGFELGTTLSWPNSSILDDSLQSSNNFRLNILKWNLDITKVLGTDKICSL